MVRTTRPLTPSEVTAARKAAVIEGLTVEVRDSGDGLAAVRTGATAVGAVLALAIVAMAIGLIRAESARDLTHAHRDRRDLPAPPCNHGQHRRRPRPARRGGQHRRRVRPWWRRSTPTWPG